ncbi:MAG: hypothetical protein Q9178_002446 [Gyalolechia marmorata]
MAILGALQAEIQVDGKALPEFDDDDLQQRASRRFVSKLVEVPLGAEFSVRVCVLGERYKPSEDLAVRLRIDGQLGFENLWRRERRDRDVNIEGLLNRTEEGITTLQPLQFSSIDFVEAAQNVSSGSMSFEQWHDLGTMTVTIDKVTNIRRVDCCPQMATPDPITTENHMLKARGITQRVTLGQARCYGSKNFRDYVYDFVTGEHTVATFEFKYRTKEVLALILNPSKNLADKSIEKLSREELQVFSSDLQVRPGSPSFNSTMDRIISQSTGLSDTYGEMGIDDKAHPESVSGGSSTLRNPPEPVAKQSSTSNEPPEPISRQPSPSSDAPEPISKSTNDSSSSSDDGGTIKKASNQRTMGLWHRVQRLDTPSGSVPKRKRDYDAIMEEFASEDDEEESDEATEEKPPSRKFRREE